MKWKKWTLSVALLPVVSCVEGDPKGTCVDACVVGAARCHDAVIERCASGSECASWSPSTDCAATGQSCVESNGEAVCEGGCANPCDTEGATQCRTTFIQSCTAVSATCQRWVDGTNCLDSDQYCDDTSGEAECADAGSDFPIRVPQARTLECPGREPGDPPVIVDYYSDTDLVCTFQYGDINAEIYVQATPTGCAQTGMSGTPTFDGGVTGWIKRDGVVAPMDASYEWGGNHHNDSFFVRIDDRDYALGHSSLGVGWRVCAPVDCIVVCGDGVLCDPWDPGDPNVEEFGCDREAGSGPPPLPVTCVKVNSDGSVPPLLDPWQQHVEDEDYPLLPCGGD